MTGRDDIELEYKKLKQEYKDFAYVVSHDVNAPLRHIREFLKILFDSIDNRITDNDKRIKEIILDSVSKEENMMRSLLDFSRLNNNMNYEEIKLKDIAEKSIKKFEEVIWQKKAYVKAELKDLSIYGDKNLIQRLFEEIISNSLKFSAAEENPKIKITGERKNSKVKIKFSDNGIGISKNSYEEVFKPMRMLHSKEKYHGVGMGLTIAKKIVENHNGYISVTSNNKHGITTIVELPVKKRTSS